MSKKTRAPRTRLDPVDRPMRELSRDELEMVNGGALPCSCPCPKPQPDFTETWPKHDTDLMDLD